MPNYVVSIEDLQQVQGRLAAQVDELVTAQGGVDATVRELTDAVTAGIAAAQQRIEGRLGELAGSVSQSRSLADAAHWTGPDSDAFRAATADLLSTIEHARDGLLAGVEAHRLGAAALREQVDAATTVFEDAAGALADSSARLEGAVAEEATGYEEAFNGGFGVAGGASPPPPGGGPGAAPVAPDAAADGGISAGDLVHGALDVLGFVPVLGAAPDLLNAAIYAYQGDTLNAAISVGAAVPIVGDAGKAGKMIYDGARFVARSEEVAASAAQGARLHAQLALDEAVGGAGRRIMEGRINDTRYPEDMWAKMEHVHRALDGTPTTIHYWQNLNDGSRHGFKFK